MEQAQGSAITQRSSSVKHRSSHLRDRHKINQKQSTWSGLREWVEGVPSDTTAKLGCNTIDTPARQVDPLTAAHLLLADQAAADRLHKLVRLTLWSLLMIVLILSIVSIVRPEVPIAIFGS
jgi:hypothetical protein